MSHTHRGRAQAGPEPRNRPIRGAPFNSCVSTPSNGRSGRASNRTTIGRRAAEVRRGVGAQIVTLRLDSHISQRRLSDAAEIDQGFLSRIEAGQAEPSFAALTAIAEVLGADLSVRLHPTTGPRIRDHIQASMSEALLEIVHPSWHRLVEVAVRRPARGFIDVVLGRAGGPVIATELHSELRRLEQQIRWAHDKAASLPSADAWTFLTQGSGDEEVSRLLVLRSTRATRDLARDYASTLATAYPARTQDAVEALVQPDRPWPGAALIWADVAKGTARILPTTPRSLSFGR
jgi:transcriptional regulator with XRE-family HTH domain